MKRRIWPLLLVGLLLLLSACAPQPDSEFDQHFSMEQWVRGGSKQDLIHVTDIAIKKQGEHQIVSLQFARETGKGDTEPTSPPQFTLDALREPARLVLSLGGVVNWDASLPPLNPAGALVRGVFRVNRNKDANAYLYIQLSKESAFRVLETEHGLDIYVRALTEQDNAEGYYVVADAISDYESGSISDKLGLTPTLCRDSTRLLISKPFETDEAAREHAVKVINAFKNINGKQAVIQRLQRNVLPEYTDGADIAALKDIKIFEGNGETELWQTGMRFLAWTPGGEALMARRSSVSDIDLLEELWIYDTGSGARQLVDQPFSAIGDAKISPDGKMIAFTEVTSSYQKLYILDVATGNLTYPDDQTYISGFDWGEDGRLYYMGGEDVVALIAYDPATEIMQFLEDIPGVEGDFAVSDGYVVFSDDLASIYRLHPDNGQRVRVAEGAEFSISPDGKHIAVLAYENSEEFDTYSRLYIMDFDKREITEVSAGRMVGDLCWDSDNSTLYYALYREDIAEYIYDLYAFSLNSGGSVAMGSSQFLSMEQASTPGRMVCNANVPVGEEYIMAVYRFLHYGE